MNEQLKQEIEKKAKEISENSNGSWMDMCTESIESTLQTPSILRHADPEIMKQAGWVKNDDLCGIHGHSMYLVTEVDNGRSKYGYHKCSRCGFEHNFQYDYNI